jgi:hypothetical protein
MPATSYKVWAWGPPVGIGATGACYVGVAGVANKATAAEPFIVANEIFCNSILDFNLAGQALPPVTASTIVAAFPRLSWGIILFDMLVMNGDRHGQNIAHDTATQKVQIFDHSHAFLRPQGDIAATLAANDGNLGFGGHCLAQEIDTFDGFDIWNERIKLTTLLRVW